MTDYGLCPLNLSCSAMGLQSNGRCVNLRDCITWADYLASRQTDHQLCKQDRRWHCTGCGYIWRAKPQGACPRAQQYGPNRPYPGVAATKSELCKMGLEAIRLPAGVAWSMSGKRFYDLYDLKAVAPLCKAKLRIFRVLRLWKGELAGVERTWKGMPEGVGWLASFYTFESAQQELIQLRSRPCSPPEETWELRHVPGLPDQIYALVSYQPAL